MSSAAAAVRKFQIQNNHITLSEEEIAKSNFKDFIPSWEQNKTYPPLEFFQHHDRGTFADPELPNLLPKDGDYTKKSITPKLGTEIDGVQLSQLTDEGKDELALLVAQRGLLVFRNQDFTDHGPKFAVEFGKYYGPLHIHPVSGAPIGYPELHIAYRNKDYANQGNYFKNKTNSIAWHTDVSYELQPPGITFFSVLEGPESGGDTAFADTIEAYERLSPEFKGILDGLYVEHSSVEQASFVENSGPIKSRRDPVKNIHPLIRVHPVTGKKILYVNPQFSRRIIGFKEEESKALLAFLYDHIANSHDLQARAHYEANTVVIWDNRRVVHTAVNDWDDTDATRIAVRITPQAERPIADLKDLNKEDKNRLADA
ncbi:alpha-ketoglutarate-dependent sulfonate dioxygenase [Yamadazyma tenuis]|uniref:TauD/TfdA-like domain-containing protein n=1 Tax=Candida tenuis (strain ATCC 10573 / BCRC 21748 / CBS 615 / JCM 9827 / NBRC 10315 / NRRL Y-1498 / VKM Y-70) TaxID=590646 RepID=G3B504_CANTC|nr:uncharacterized protein CANTEDRAFT_122040 [Yamadazyma tenuis ATCC 10573]EGV64029.1 hypothetical protein CANTEDRAFT_122040 [Yamadazyma tenuis ATCC 10573]WEJ96349.1 alpha-ketoglutarate-dependent sulfonate dioxygenase [Yamadazyma tenuis]